MVNCEKLELIFLPPVEKLIATSLDLKGTEKMQRQIINGVPYFADTQNRLFTWDTEAQPQHIGAYNPTAGTITYEPNHLDSLATRLQVWREKQQPRDRKATNSGRTTRGGASKRAQDSEDDE